MKIVLDVLRRVRHAVLEETNQKQLVYENGALVAKSIWPVARKSRQLTRAVAAD